MGVLYPFTEMWEKFPDFGGLALGGYTYYIRQIQGESVRIGSIQCALMQAAV